MDKSYYDADFESVLKDFEKNSTLKNKGVKTDDDFDTKYKRQEVGITDKKTGKTIPPFDRATQTLKKLATASKIGKAVAIPIALGTAAYEALKDRKENKSEIPSNVENKAKGGMTKGQKKVGRVMREFKKGELHSGKKGPVVKNPKQAIAIALSEAGMFKPQKKQDGGMIRFKKQYQMHNGKF
jgi:hypothetical protein